MEKEGSRSSLGGCLSSLLGLLIGFPVSLADLAPLAGLLFATAFEKAFGALNDHFKINF